MEIKICKCKDRKAIYWNSYNKVVQCHICGSIYQIKESIFTKIRNWFIELINKYFV